MVEVFYGNQKSAEKNKVQKVEKLQKIVLKCQEPNFLKGAQSQAQWS